MRLMAILSILFSSSLVAAQIVLNPSPVSGEILLNASNTYIYLSNSSSVAITPSISVGSNSNGISLSLNRCTSSLRPAQSCYVVVSFPSYSSNSQSISVPFKNGSSDLATLKFNPTVVAPQVSNFSVSSLALNDFNAVSFIVQNKTSITKSYSPVIGGVDASKYSITLNRCNSIPANGTCQVFIKLAPQLAGSYSATITEPQVTGSISVSSTITSSTVGVIQPPNPSIQITESSVNFGTLTQLGTSSGKIVTVSNNGNIAVSPIVSIAGSGLSIGLNRCLVLLAPGQSCTASLVFTATSSMTNGSQSGLSFSAQATSSTSVLSIPVSVTLNINPVLLTSSSGQTSGSQLLSHVFGSTLNGGSYHYSPVSGLFSWGSNSYGNIGDGTTNTYSTPFWNSGVSPLQGKLLQSVSISEYHSCVSTTDNKIYCWGYNYAGQVGDGTLDQRNSPTLTDLSILGTKTVKYVSTGTYTSCALTNDGYVYCWGANGSGEVGANIDGSQPPFLQFVSNPTQVYWGGVLAGKTAKEIYPSYSHSCILANDDRLYCWGSGSGGLLGNGSQDNQIAPVAVDWTGVLAGKTVKKVSMTYANVCIIASDDQAYCWGGNYTGSLGDSSPFGAGSMVPVAVDTSGVLAGKTVKEIEVSDTAVCVIASDDKVYCWGGDFQGSLGSGGSGQTSSPVAVDWTGVLSGKTAKKIALPKFSGTTFCIIASDDKPYCWGNNFNGQLGLDPNTFPNSNVPVAVDHNGLLAGKTVLDIKVEGNTVCVRASDDKIYCIGMGDSGQLGDGNGMSSSSFVLSSSGSGL